MAGDYIGVYEALLEEAGSRRGRAALPEARIPIAVPLPVAAEERQPAAWVDQAGAAGS
jgi:hypothetical protein